ncbi:uncharacterized protein [Henckelia pumila]|uniref:uncharacterized protein n=1 Tax=Henckelia pumila TaxID=405737 RepID=UPI003C6DEB62
MRDDEVPGPKPRAQWTSDENTAAIYNAKALNDMFNYVDMNMFNLIGTCTCARDAWEKLQTHCEGSASVKKTRMHLLTSKFEKLRMEESETIIEYNGRLKSLANEASVLGDPISNERLVSKVLRSLPKRFHTKFCDIDESKDTSLMGLDELISSLRTYDMEMKAEDDTKVQQEVKESDLEKNSIALISKKFTDYLKRSLKIQLILEDLVKGMKEKAEQADLISFTALMESKKNVHINPHGVGSGVATPGRNKVQKSVCFVSSNLDNSSDHEEQVADAYTLEGIQKLYEEVYCDWIKRNQLKTTLTKENTELKAPVSRLEVLMSKKDLELGLLNSELERAKTTLVKFNSSSSKLDYLLTMGKNDKFGLGFKESVFETGESSKTPVFVTEGSDSLNHPSNASKGNWYFDSESSRHMTGLKDHLMDYIEHNGGRVTYGGGAKGRIVGKGTLNVEGFPKLHNVLHGQDQLINSTNLVRNWHVDTQRLMSLVYDAKSLDM